MNRLHFKKGFFFPVLTAGLTGPLFSALDTGMFVFKQFVDHLCEHIVCLLVFFKCLRLVVGDLNNTQILIVYGQFLMNNVTANLRVFL